MEDAALRSAIDVYARGMLAAGKFSPAGMVEALSPAMRVSGCRTRPFPGKAGKSRILILRDDAAGDFVLFSPVLREVRRIYPEAEITLVTSPRNHALAELCPYVDHVVLGQEAADMNDLPALFGVALRLAERLRQTYGPFDLAFCPRIGICSVSLIVAYLTGARERVGWTQERVNTQGEVVRNGWDVLLTESVPFPMLPLHDVDRNLLMLEHLLRCPVANRALEVWISSEDAASAEAVLAPLAAAGLRRVYAVAAAASLPMKQWPPERYAQVLARIAAEEPDAGFALLGGPADAAAADVVAAALGTRCVALAGKVSFRVSAAVLARCALYIGDDTGLMHIAAAVHVPVLSVNCFPASLPFTTLSIPVRFAPYRVPSVTVVPRAARDGCDDSWRYGCSHAREPHCILGVSPEVVYAAYRALVSRAQAGEQKPLIFKA